MSNSNLWTQKAAWPASLATSTIFGSLLLACIFPFAAFAALAALTMKPRHGLALIGGAWAVNQALGFFVMSFPWDAQAVGHGIAILAAVLAAYGAARMVLTLLSGHIALRGGLALAAAFITQQIVLRAYAQYGGGTENFSADIVSAVALNDALWFAGLMALRYVISRLNGEGTLLADPA